MSWNHVKTKTMHVVVSSCQHISANSHQTECDVCTVCHGTKTVILLFVMESCQLKQDNNNHGADATTMIIVFSVNSHQTECFSLSWKQDNSNCSF